MANSIRCIKQVFKCIQERSTCYTYAVLCDQSRPATKFPVSSSIKLFCSTRIPEKDTFGDLSNSQISALYDRFNDDTDSVEETPLRRNVSQRKYVDLIKNHVSAKKIDDAIAVLEVKMLKEDRVKPEYFIYGHLITACAKTGRTKKAFKLFNQMKKRGLTVTSSIYTSLFNACANTSNPQTGLKYALHLRELMRKKGVLPNVIIYNSMVKAFGHCGDLSTAFAIVDEMVEKAFDLKIDTFNFLLQACVSDKSSGLLHALLVWKKIQEKKLKPDLYTYNLLLHCIRDCHIGEVEVAKKLLQRTYPTANNWNYLLNDLQIPKLQGEVPYFNDVLCQLGDGNNSIAKEKIERNLVNASPCDRLQLIGGIPTLLKLMQFHGVKPDIKTFTFLLDCTPPSTTHEEVLLSIMNHYAVPVDIDFFNMLIKKRCMRFDYNGAKDVLNLIQEAKLLPDVVSFGVLALTCQSEQEADRFLLDMSKLGFSCNSEILGTMLKTGCVYYNFKYIVKIMNIAIKKEVFPNLQFLKHLESFNKRCKEIIKNQDWYKLQKYEMDQDYFVKAYIQFEDYYNVWLKSVKSKESVHITNKE